MQGILNQLERRRWLTPLVLAVLTLAFFYRLILPGRVLVGDDLRNFFYPMLTFVVEGVRAGELPLWNPHLFAGVSVVADPEIAIFYPPNWLMLLAGVERGASLLLALHVWWAGWGMAKLARSLGASALGGLFGGVTYAFSGWLAAQVWAGHYTLAEVAAWVPWVLLAYRHAIRLGSWRAALPGMAAVGLSVLAGYPPLLVHLGLLLVALAILHVLQADARRRALVLAARQLALMGVGGLLLASVQLLPVTEFTRFSTRGVAANLQFAGEYALPGAQLLTLVFPNLLGSPVRPESYWGSPFYEELMGYVGLWALAAFLLALRLRDGAVRLLLALAALGLVLSLGPRGGLFVALLRVVPFFRLFRVPGRYLYLTVVALAGLSALAVTRLQVADPETRREGLRPLWRIWIPGAVALALLAAGGLRIGARFVPPEIHEERLLAMSDAVLAAGLVMLGVGVSLWLWGSARSAQWGAPLALVVVTLDLWRVGLPLLRVEPSPPGYPLWEEIGATVPAGDPTSRVMPLIDAFWEQNGAAASGHYTIFGYESLEPDAYTRFVALSDQPIANNNRLLGVRYLVTTPPHDALGLAATPTQTLVSEGAHHVYRLEEGLPRALVASTFEVISDDEEARERLMDDDFNPASTVILDRQPGCPTEGSGAARLASYGPNRVTVRVEADGPALLVLSDQWYPGWTAQVDGQAADVLRADTVLRAVCIPSGAHTVRFAFRPASLRWGGWVSLAGWLALALAAMAPQLRRVILPPRT